MHEYWKHVVKTNQLNGSFFFVEDGATDDLF